MVSCEGFVIPNKLIVLSWDTNPDPVGSLHITPLGLGDKEDYYEHEAHAV